MNRRHFVMGAAGVALSAAARPAFAAPEPRLLTVTRRTLEVKGRAASVYGITGPDGKPGLSLLLGERFRVRLQNAADAATIVHWHGLTPPFGQDGVAGLGQEPVSPGAFLDYDFANLRSGTHWMHSHIGLQQQQLLAAPLIVRETAEPVFDTQEHVVVLHDFTFRDPAAILAELRSGGGAHAAHSGMAGMDHGGMDHGASGGMAGMSGMAGMMSFGLSDIAYDAYLANDRTLEDPEVVPVEKGGTLRLRVINAAAASNMWIDLGSLGGALIATDGNAIQPLAGRLFPIAAGQRADLRIKVPDAGGAFPVLFRPEGTAMRTGIVLATPGAAIARMAEEGEIAPAVDLTQERLYRAIAKLPDEPVTRTEMLMLTGGEQGYLWGFNGQPFAHETLFSVRQGERISLMIHNMTGMPHPMHLHGHYFKITAVNGVAIDGALRDVVLVPPMETVALTFDADNPGTWPLHCHHAYHMNSGMMGMMAYTSAA